MSENTCPYINECTYPNALPLFVPIPSLDRHIIAPSQHNTQRRVDGQTTNVIWVRLESNDLLVSVIIEDSKLKIVRARDEPILSGDEAHASHRYLCDFKSLDECACLVVVDVDSSVVKTGEQPWFRWVEVDTLDTV